jgi:hypothetical protein
MRSLFVAIAFGLAALLIQSPSAQAVEIDFSAIGPEGNLNVTSYTDPATGLIVSGYYYDGTAWVPANLFLRNIPNDHGLGVCNPVEAAENGGNCPIGAGDINELDNAGNSELIVLTLPAGYEWTSVQISSLDASSGVPERGILYADSDGVFNPPGGSVGDTVIETFEGLTDPVEATFPIPAAFAASPYLVFEPFDFTAGGSTDNDYLVYKATIELADEGGGEGCTPGYWKQPQHLDSWVTYLPTDFFDTVFGVTSSFGSTFTLLQALKQGGGGEKALGRHAVAALLNSVNPDVSYEFTTAEVIAIVQEAYATGDFKAAKKLLEEQNESGCPLN